jgi:hypothetical protein
MFQTTVYTIRNSLLLQDCNTLVVESSLYHHVLLNKFADLHAMIQQVPMMLQ